MQTIPPLPSSAALTGIILAGGEGRRMGGADKGLLRLDGRCLVEHVLARLAPQVDALCIVANRNLSQYEALTAPYGGIVVPDEPAWSGRHDGPLAGFVAGLRACATAQAVVVPVDARSLPADLVARLRGAGVPSQVARMPVCALLARTQLVSLQRAFEQGERSPQRWLRHEGAVELVCDDWADDDRSLNTPAEWQARAARGPSP